MDPVTLLLVVWNLVYGEKNNIYELMEFSSVASLVRYLRWDQSWITTVLRNSHQLALIEERRQVEHIDFVARTMTLVRGVPPGCRNERVCVLQNGVFVDIAEALPTWLRDGKVERLEAENKKLRDELAAKSTL